MARANGADGPVLFPSDGAVDAIKASAPNGADVVFDPVCGDAFDLSLRAVAQRGRILVIGFANGRIQQIPANILLVKNISVLGFKKNTPAGASSMNATGTSRWCGLHSKRCFDGSKRASSIRRHRTGFP
jgi:NADPH:quinone reductase-like Zn-dependent oxidoreductase